MMRWNTPLTEWTSWMKAAARPQTTIALRLYQLRRFADDHRDPWAVSTKEMLRWLAHQDWSPETRRSYRSALRSFYAWGYVSGYMDHDPAALLPPIRVMLHPPRTAPEVVLEQALTRAEPRVRLMLLLAARQGMRRGEIALVHSDDVTRDLTGWSLRVHGKGNKERVIPLHDEIALALRVQGSGFLFPGQIRGHLSPRRVGELMSDALGPGWSAHTLRHRFATIAYRGSRDLLAVQELLGHSKPETTRNYVQLPDDALRSAMRWAA